MKKIILFIFALCCLSEFIKGQVDTSRKGTTHKDSSIYRPTVPKETTHKDTTSYGNSDDVTNHEVTGDQGTATKETPHKDSFLENFLKDYLNNRPKDTVVPKGVYIPSTLIKHDILPTADAQELFLALNPKLYDLNQVHTLMSVKLPDFPKLEGQQKKEYKASFKTGQKPNGYASNEFARKVDSLNDLLSIIRNNSVEKYNAVEKRLTKELLQDINQFSRSSVFQTNRVTVDWLSKLMTQMNSQLSIINKTGQSQKKQNPYTILEEISNAIRTLIPSSEELRKSLGSAFYPYDPEYFHINSGKRGFLNARIDLNNSEINNQKEFNSFDNGLIPFEVVVWRYTKEDGKPLTNDTALNGKYEVFYCLQAYPGSIETSSGNASTTGVNLPITKYWFWTKNVDTGVESKKMLIDTETEFLKFKRKLSYWDRLVIPIRVSN